MRDALATLFVLVLLVAGVGWYFQWYNVEVDTKKINKDFSTLRDKIRQAVEHR